MAGRSRQGSSPFAWSTVFYLLLVFIAPLAFTNTANAQNDQTVLQENYGTGKDFVGGANSEEPSWLIMSQSLVSILGPRIRKFRLCCASRGDVLLTLA